MPPASPLRLALNGTVLVPVPMSCCGVDWLPLMELLVLYRNQTWVSAPFGSAQPPSVALLLVTAEAEPVLTVAGPGALVVKLATEP